MDNASNAVNILLARLGLAANPFNETSPNTPVVDPEPAVLLDLSTAYGPFVGYYEWLEASRGVEVITADVVFPSTTTQVIAAVTKVLESRERAGLQLPTVAVVSQVSSIPAVVMPVKELTELLHSYGVPILVDGAHALGNVPCELSGADGVLGDVDFWFGNAHKWLFAPKSVAVMYVRSDYHPNDEGVWPEPTVVDSYGDEFTSRFIWDGTRDRSPFCAVKDALAFREWLGGEEAIMKYNHELAKWAGDYLAERWNTSVLTYDESMLNSMVNVVAPTQNYTLCSKSVSKLLSEHDMELTGAATLDADHGDVACYLRLSAQVFLEKSDFVQLGELMWEYLNPESA